MDKKTIPDTDVYLFASYLFRDIPQSTIYYGTANKQELYEHIKERVNEDTRIPICVMIFDKEGNVEHLEGPIKFQEGQWKLMSTKEELGGYERPETTMETHQSFVECALVADEKRIENEKENNTLKTISFEIYICHQLNFKVFFQRANA